MCQEIHPKIPIDLTRVIDPEVSMDEVIVWESAEILVVLVKFYSYRGRRKVYGVRIKTKDNGYRGVFINKNLSKLRNMLLMKARQMTKTKHIPDT